MEARTNQLFPSMNPEEAELNSALFACLLDSLCDGVYFVDRSRKILYWNKGAERLTGYEATEVVWQSCDNHILVHASDSVRSHSDGGSELGRASQDGKQREIEIYIRHKLGDRFPALLRMAPIFDNFGNLIGEVGIFTDVSAKKRIERRVGELENLVYLDALTGISNRRYMELKVRQAIQEVEQFDREIGLLLLDVDNFKAFNDNHGHSVGDEALKAICNTLSHNLRAGDLLGRWGGEEFLILATEVNGASLRAFSERCRILVAESCIPVSGKILQVTISVGATLIRKDDSLQSVVQRADELMYQSKSEGRNRITSG
jgi:diguanylate cyclase (GGDEF)-like protein/PAS domain S-box-containing protein